MTDDAKKLFARLVLTLRAYRREEPGQLGGLVTPVSASGAQVLVAELLGQLAADPEAAQSLLCLWTLPKLTDYLVTPLGGEP